MNIVGFAQLRNESRAGNIMRFANNMEELCDQVYVWDQDSDDNSRDYYETFGWEVVYSAENLFHNEIACKAQLLEMVKKEEEGWVLWLDGDSILNTDLATLTQLLYHAETNGNDCVSFGHINLWENEQQYRIDNNYMHLDDIGVMAAWKISPNLSFYSAEGLHSLQYPTTLRTPLDARDIKIHHYGFLTQEMRQAKHDLYKSMGQTGLDLDRILDVSTLTLKEL